jgi:hypothetical protein
LTYDLTFGGWVYVALLACIIGVLLLVAGIAIA